MGPLSFMEGDGFCKTAIKVSITANNSCDSGEDIRGKCSRIFLGWFATCRQGSCYYRFVDSSYHRCVTLTCHFINCRLGQLLTEYMSGTWRFLRPKKVYDFFMMLTLACWNEWKCPSLVWTCTTVCVTQPQRSCVCTWHLLAKYTGDFAYSTSLGTCGGLRGSHSTSHKS